MSFIVLLLFFFAAITIPTAAKVFAISSIIYAVIQALKNVPLLTPYIKGWVAIILNVVLSIVGVVVTVGTQNGVDAIYTTQTLFLIIQAFGTAAGIHGTVSKLIANQKAIDNTPPKS